MKLIKYWHVKLYQLSQQSPVMSVASSGGSGGNSVLSKLIAAGYSIDTFALPHRDGFITLLTDPYGAESKAYRADSIDSIVFTPVYDDGGKESKDPAEAKGRYDHDGFKLASRPLVKWLNENANPHSSVTVEVDGATLYTGEMNTPIREFLKD